LILKLPFSTFALDAYTTNMNAPDSLENNLLFQIGEVARLLHKNLVQTFEEKGFGVTPEQFSVLALLWYREGINQQDIANELRRDKTTIARMVENMIKKNLIVKVPDQLDRRNNLVYLTQKGKELQTEMIEASGVAYFKTMQNLTPEEITFSLSVLKKLGKNLV
jgi:DNA-binding MarR family transcriptional regulator